MTIKFHNILALCVTPQAWNAQHLAEAQSFPSFILYLEYRVG
jgi:hypothetical protein